MPRILFRADASSRIGTGHVVRCLTLASVLRERGWRTAITGRMPDELADAATAEDVDVRRLPEDIPAADEPGFLRYMGVLDADVVVVDHYGIDAAWHCAVAAHGPLLAAIDDLAAGRMAAALVLNQNLGAAAAAYDGLVDPGTTLLLGPQYALIRPAFAETRRSLGPRDGRVRRLLVFLSGADEADVTGRAAEAAASTGLPTDVVIGSAYPFAERLERWAAARPAVRLHVNTADMPELMGAADVAIGAPSSASWERCALGLPSILIVLADNQVEIGARLTEAGAGINLGWHDGVTSDRIAAAIAELVSDVPRVRSMSAAAADVTDGLGASRVADALERLIANPARA